MRISDWSSDVCSSDLQEQAAMEYTLTRIDKNSQRYPMEQRSQVPDPLEEQLNKNIFLGKLEDMMHGVVNWGRKNSIWPYNFGLSCCYVEMATAFTPTHEDRKSTRLNFSH